jgi:hypothetical protein
MTCAFCGSPFDSNNPHSQEHAFASWLETILPQHHDPFRHTAENRQGEVLAQWVADDLSVITKRVCVRCNSGWMSDLETAAGDALSCAAGPAPARLTSICFLGLALERSHEQSATGISSQPAGVLLGLRRAGPSPHVPREPA